MRAMKDSGIAWMGQIPLAWGSRKVKHCFNVIAGATPKSGNAEYWDGDVVWVTPADYKTEDKYVNSGHKTITEAGVESCATTIIPVNSIVFSKRAPVGSVAINTVPLCTNQGCLSCVPKEGINTTYYYYVMSVLAEQFEALASGTTFMELSVSSFEDFVLPMPEHSMQERIAAYLDEKCTSIDAMIAAKETENERLREYRQSVIYEAVTKGLDADAPMKDSGVEWIGEIPAGWTVERLKYFADLNPKTIIPEYDEDDAVSFIPMECLKAGYHHTSENIYKKVKSGYVVFSDGDILMAKVTPCLENGNLAIATGLEDGVGFGSTEINVIRCKKIETRYLFYMFQTQTFIKRATADMYGVAGLKRLNPSFIPNARCPIPTEQEQRAIVDYLDEKCTSIDALIAANESAVVKLKEYRQSAIYEAVTGKIEV